MTVTIAAPAVTAADIMSRSVVTVAPTESAWTAWSIMQRTGLRHLVVAAGEECLGVLNDRTLMAQWFEGPLVMRRRQVRELLPAGTTCVLPGTELRMVAQVMAWADADAIPVVEDNGHVAGIVTASDIVRAVASSGIRREESS
jgi:CBS-domain-containing membrane protein